MTEKTWQQNPLIPQGHRVFWHALSPRRRRILLTATALATLIVGTTTFIVYQNVTALAKLHTSQQQDKAGKYTEAKATLQSINLLGVWPATITACKNEQASNTKLISNAQKIQQAKQLLKEHNTAAALSLLNSVTPGSSDQAQINQLKKAVQSQATVTTTSSSSGSTKTSSSGTTSSGNTSNAGTGTGQSAGSSGGTTTQPPGPMSQITINAFSATASPHNASSCLLTSSVNFSVNGSGSVQVTWMTLSSKTSSAIDNPVTYSFSAAGSQSDSPGGVTLQGLEPGDSYRVSAVITDTANGAVTTTAGPTILTTCAAPPSLEAASQQSFMTSAPTSTSFTSSQAQDNLFPNECSMNFQEAFSVSGPGSVQVTYTITSSASIGATLFASQQWDFTGPGTATDSSYIRMPHIPGGGSYTITATLNVLGDTSHSATTAPITSACS